MNSLKPLSTRLYKNFHLAKFNLQTPSAYLSNSLSVSKRCLTYITPEFSVDYLIIGGGVIGLSITERLSRRKGNSVLLVEKNLRLCEKTR